MFGPHVLTNNICSRCSWDVAFTRVGRPEGHIRGHRGHTSGQLGTMKVNIPGNKGKAGPRAKGLNL